jgi:hypothetical protein
MNSGLGADGDMLSRVRREDLSLSFRADIGILTMESAGNRYRDDKLRRLGDRLSHI